MADSPIQNGRDRPVPTEDASPSEETIQALESPALAALVTRLLFEYENGSALPHHFAKRILHEVGVALVEDGN